MGGGGGGLAYSLQLTGIEVYQNMAVLIKKKMQKNELKVFFFPDLGLISNVFSLSL